MKQEVEENVKLIKEKESLKNEVFDRIKSGQLIISKDITNQIESDKWWDDFIDWDIYNHELIKQAFDLTNNSYAEDYKRKTSIGGVFFPGEYVKPSFQESVKNNRDSMEYQLRKLKWFYDKIDLLKTHKPINSLNIGESHILKLVNLLERFHKVAQELRERRLNKETLIIKDEYDVQDLLNALLQIHFDDVRKEEFSPSSSGSNSRIDFVLKREEIILEVKMSNDSLGANKIGKELLVDIGRYKEYPNCSNLVIFIYDRGDFIRNKRGFIDDLQNQSVKGLTVTVVINPN